MNFRNNVPFNGNQALNFRFEILAASPSGRTDGTVWYNSTANRLEVQTPGGVKQAQWVGEGGGTDATTLSGNNAAFYLNRANHSGQQTSGSISDFSTAVTTHRLDQMAAPTSAVSLNAQRITNLAAPTGAADAATKAYVDGAIQGFTGSKDAVRLVTTANHGLSGLAAIDGITPVGGDRILVAANTNAAQNGIYLAAAGAWARAADADASGELKSGIVVAVMEGTTYADSQWMLTSDVAIVVGTTNQTWTYINRLADIVPGDGLTKTGNTLNVGSGTGILVTADAIAIDTTLVPRKVSFNVGDAAATVFTLTHNLNTRDVQVIVYESASPWADVMPTVDRPSVNTVRLSFSIAPTANQFRAVVVG